MDKKYIELKAAAVMVDGELVGDGSVVVSNMASLDASGPEDITFLAKISAIESLLVSKAGAALVPIGFKESLTIPVIRVKDPYLASAILHNHLLARPFQAEGIHARACVGKDCAISDQVSIGPLVVVGDGVKIGDRVTIEPGTVVGDGVEIGEDTILKANVTIAHGCILGRRIIIHSGTVIGSDGYGYATDSQGNHVKRPQVGKVRIDDDVEIGSNVCIDRGAFGDTWIQSGAKIDNQVQVGHNVVVGPNSLIVSQVGISGSTTLGRNVVIAGKGAINGHIHIADQAVVAGKSGVVKSLAKGARVAGFPAMPAKTWARCSALYAKLPEIYSEVKKLRKAVASLQKK